MHSHTGCICLTFLPYVVVLLPPPLHFHPNPPPPQGSRQGESPYKTCQFSWWVDISGSAVWTTLCLNQSQVSRSFGAKPLCQDTLFLLTLNRIHGLVEDLEVADRVGGGTASSKRSGCQQDDTWLASGCPKYTGWCPLFLGKSPIMITFLLL